jgi:hypothetical protein
MGFVKKSEDEFLIERVLFDVDVNEVKWFLPVNYFIHPDEFKIYLNAI